MRNAMLALWGILFIGRLAAQNNGISDAAKRYVDPFSGDFSYAVPLVVIPGPNGESFPVIANYHSGIGMEQQSSWLGLGWTLNIGEITRMVNGIPDDWRNRRTTETEVGTSNTPVTTDMWGPLYLDEMPPNSTSGSATEDQKNNAMDIYQSTFMQQGSQAFPFTFPDYDDYAVSGPDIGGVMQPHIFKYGCLSHKNDDDITYYTTQFGPSNANYDKVHFRFNADHTTISSHYSNAGVGGFHDQAVNQLGGDFSAWQSVMQYFDLPSYTNTGSNCPSDNTILWSEYFIEYCTHEDINSQLSTLHSNGFLNLPAYDANAAEQIAGFKITTPSGFTYHYTLPVYAWDERVTNFKIKDDFMLHNTAGNVKEVTRPDKYAATWKLTAITGPDYVDANNDHQVGGADKGYWILLEYGLWLDNYQVQTPYSDYVMDFGLKKWANRPDFSYANTYADVYEGEGTIVRYKTQVYYLNTIKTASHTAFFVKDTRLDDHDILVNGSTTEKRPLMKLTHIVLMRNDDVGSNFSSISSISSQLQSQGFTSGSSGLHTSNVINKATYENYLNGSGGIKALALQVVELEQDYSLCRKYIRNINCTPTYYTDGTYGNTSTSQFNRFSSVSAGSNNVNITGKLTLKKIGFYQEGFTKQFGDHEFTYNSGTNNVKNPDYHPFKKDNWGYYKSDADVTCTTGSNAVYYPNRGYYCTPGSQGSYLDVDAWSLVQIKNPLGAVLTVEYEADEYEWAGNPFATNMGLVRPQRIFPAKDVTFVNTSPRYSTMTFYNKDVNKFYNLSEKEKSYYAFRYTHTGYIGNNCGSTYTAIDNTNSVTAPGDLFYLIDPAFTTFNTSTLEATPYTGTTANFMMGPYIQPNNNCYPNSVTFQKNYMNDPNMLVNLGYYQILLNKAYGGGIRVKRVTLTDPYSSQGFRLKYTYKDGIATTEPDNFGPVYFRGELTKTALGVDRHVPMPSVGYTHVSVEAEDKANGRVDYELRNYENNVFCPVNSVSYSQTSPTYICNISQIMKLGVHNYLLGAALKEKVYDKNGNMVSLVESEYSIGGGRIGETFYTSLKNDRVIMGCIPEIAIICHKETYNYVLSKTTSVVDGIKVVTEFRDHDPLTGVPLTTIVTDPTYGLRTIRRKMAWNESAYAQIGPKSVNRNYANILSPVYMEYTAAGLDDPTDINSTNGVFSASKTTFNDFSSVTLDKYLDFNSSGSYYTLGDNPNSYTIWGSEKSYVWEGSNYDPQKGWFSAPINLASTSSSDWRLTEEVTLRNQRNQTLETRSINRRYSSVKMGYDYKYPIAEIEDANYFSFTYSGFESTVIPTSGVTHFDAEVQGGALQDQGTSTILPHTGKYMAKLTSTDQLIYRVPVKSDHSGLMIENSGSAAAGDRVFRVTVWVHNTSNTDAGLEIKLISGGGGTTTYTVYRNDANATVAGSWTRIVKDITVPYTLTTSATQLEVKLLKGSGSNTAYFDDFRVHPVDAPMMSYVYDKRTGRITHTLDADNYYTRFEYDAAGRVTNTYQEIPSMSGITGGEKKISTNIYHVVH